MVVEREAPTPLIMFAVRYYELSYGMAVTASHNPALYNGVKVFTKGGRDADETVFLNQAGQTRRLLEQVVELDRRISLRMAGEHSYYQK